MIPINWKASFHLDVSANQKRSFLRRHFCLHLDALLYFGRIPIPVRRCYAHSVKRFLLAICLSCTLFDCVHFQPPLRPVVGIPEFQQWCLRALSHPNASPEYRQFSAAYHRDPQALRAYFAEALLHCETYGIDASDGEWLNWTMETLLYRWGDDQFAAVLSRETPRVQSAISGFIVPHSWALYPKTREILRAAPKIDFPMYKAYRDG